MTWIKRFGREFTDPYTIKILFFSFIIPILEYGSQVWNTFHKDQIRRIESIQKPFLLYAFRRFDWPHRFHLPKYEHRLLLLQMISLEDRRRAAQIIFILKLIKGEISSDTLLNMINFRIPSRRLRSTQFLSVHNESCNYRKFRPMNFMLTTFNDYSNARVPFTNEFIIDFNLSSNIVKKRLHELFKQLRK